MKSHRQYVKEQIKRDPRFAKDLAEARVMVEERLDGTTRITHQGKRLRYQAILVRPIREAVKTLKPKPRILPAPNHPWHRPFKHWRERTPPAPVS